ncbi:glycoside hydrolase family 15 protein [Nocardioides sp. CN2-186]|uniref:glycoside hydrolase family 15 protein n=1 Tax=Nocardioides tweenelious TaxID=3156607 RepID=UPI0032B51808
MTHPNHPPVPLRQYALLADGERGALIGPRGNIAFLCAPQWHDDAIFSSLLGGHGEYSVSPQDARYVWGGHYEQDTLIWRSRWTSGTAVTECREALAFPGYPDRVVVLRRIEATLGDAHVIVELDCRAEFGARPMIVGRSAEGVWTGHSGDVHFRWSGAPTHARLVDGKIRAAIDVPAGAHHDLVLEISRRRLDEELPDPVQEWQRTERAWSAACPDLSSSAAPGESRHSHAVLRGLTTSSGAMVAAATTALPERANQGRNYDYRYAWIRDQCYAGLAAAAVDSHSLLDAAVRFVSARVLEDGPTLRPAYTVNGDPVPDERPLKLPGYPGAPVRVGNHVNQQFQLDALGECLLLLAAAEGRGRLDTEGQHAVESLVDAIEKRQHDPDAGIWELRDRHWAHSRLMCAAGLRAVSARRGGSVGATWERLADRLVDSVDEDCLHSDGRWQRSPHDPAVDASLLLPGIRGAVPKDDPRNIATIRAVIEKLTDDGYVYRFRHDPQVPFHEAEGAFVLSGFHLSLACLDQGDILSATRWFERNRGSLGPPGLFAEEYDVVQRQLRGNLPQAFVHALLLETAQRLGEAGVNSRGFTARAR